MINAYWLGTMIDNACVLMLAALGDAVLLTAGEYNLGGDGQIYAASFVLAVMLGATSALPPPLSLAISIATAMCVTAAMAAVSVAMKVRHGVDILLSTYLVSAATVPIIDGLIAGRCNGGGNLLATRFVPNAVSAPRILPPSTLSLASLAAPIVCVLTWLYIRRSEWGKRIAITGVSNAFADYAGLQPQRTIARALAFACAMHTCAAVVLITGTYRTCLSGGAGWMGWSALTIALLARGDALMVVPQSLLLSLLVTAAKRATLTHHVSFDASAMITGIAIAVVAVAAARRDRDKARQML